MLIYSAAISNASITIANINTYTQEEPLKAYFFGDTVKINDHYYTIDPHNPYNCFSNLFISSANENKQIYSNINNLENLKILKIIEIRTQLLLQYIKNKQEYPNEKDLGINSLEEMLHSVEPIDHEDRLSLLELIALETQVNITDWLQEQIKANQSENIESVSNIIKHIFKNEKIIELLSQNEIDRIFDIFILSKENKNLVQTNSLSVCIQEAIKKITEKSWNKGKKLKDKIQEILMNNDMFINGLSYEQLNSIINNGTIILKSIKENNSILLFNNQTLIERLSLKPDMIGDMIHNYLNHDGSRLILASNLLPEYLSQKHKMHIHRIFDEAKKMEINRKYVDHFPSEVFCQTEKWTEMVFLNKELMQWLLKTYEYYVGTGKAQYLSLIDNYEDELKFITDNSYFFKRLNNHHIETLFNMKKVKSNIKAQLLLNPIITSKINDVQLNKFVTKEILTYLLNIKEEHVDDNGYVINEISKKKVRSFINRLSCENLDILCDIICNTINDKHVNNILTNNMSMLLVEEVILSINEAQKERIIQCYLTYINNTTINHFNIIRMLKFLPFLSTEKQIVNLINKNVTSLYDYCCLVKPEFQSLHSRLSIKNRFNILKDFIKALAITNDIFIHIEIGNFFLIGLNINQIKELINIFLYCFSYNNGFKINSSIFLQFILKPLLNMMREKNPDNYQSELYQLLITTKNEEIRQLIEDELTEYHYNSH